MLDESRLPNPTLIYESMLTKGFWPYGYRDQPLMLIGKLGLISTEIKELSDYEDIENALEELADISIRVLDICGALSIDIWEYVVQFNPLNSVIMSPNPELLCTMYACVADAIELYRKGEAPSRPLRDLLIYCNQIAVYFNGNLLDEIEKKTVVNANRPYRHGKKA